MVGLMITQCLSDFIIKLRERGRPDVSKPQFLPQLILNYNLSKSKRKRKYYNHINRMVHWEVKVAPDCHSNVLHFPALQLKNKSLVHYNWNDSTRMNSFRGNDSPFTSSAVCTRHRVWRRSRRAESFHTRWEEPILQVLNDFIYLCKQFLTFHL